MKQVVAIVLCAMVALPLAAQETFPVNDVKDVRSGAYAFTNAIIHVDSGTIRNNTTMLIRDGKVESFESGSNVPEGYVEIDLEGRHVYPSFIDIYSNYGIPEVKGEPGEPFSTPEQIRSDTRGAYNANEAIRAEYDAFTEFSANNKEADSLRILGFGAVNTFRPDGLARGSSAAVTLSDESDNLVMIKSKAAAHFSFSKGTSRQMYPVSSMGYIALLRQTYLDAIWYDGADPKPFTDKTLDAWIANQTLPQIFDTGNWLSLLRADRLGDEFDVQYIIKSVGDEYRRIDAVKSTGAHLIVPVTFPAAPDVDDPLDAYHVSLEDMKHWELAPSNLAALEEAGIEFAVTASGLEYKKDFWPNLRKAIRRGLSEQTALSALTTVPATLLGIEDRVGSLQPGREANFLITSSGLFDRENVIVENWIQGKRFEISDPDAADLAGQYNLIVENAAYNLEISGEPGKHSAKIVIDDSTSSNVTLEVEDNSLTLIFDPDPGDEDARDIRLSGWIEADGFGGTGQTQDGSWVNWNAAYQTELETSDENENGKDDPDELDETGPVIYPFVAYGRAETPRGDDILIRNATVWTMEDETRVLENADVLIRDGKIAAVGSQLEARDVTVIDATGKHVTPGIVDEHSHIAATSINDVATNSGMVRIGDVIDSEDIGIYRALSGGVTAVQILHGSANPIGGQSALIKLRWGSLPEEMKIQDADRFIKFALGENVKRSFSVSSIRYPQTRMGVEQVYVDAFTSARDYIEGWETYNNLSASEKRSTNAPRRDLAMETMAEILRGQRFISCHSYVQSEINMLMKVAERFGFRVNTFTHILEGYKVADKMAEHGAGASTFADWWAYKWEVRYAIPYNATIMMREGVTTAINSDDGEMMRRLNQEAAKSIKYGGLSEYDALKMVTINPAKLLHLDSRLGSIAKGKDADVVIWSANPLSIYALVEKTFVDGVKLYDVDEDREMKEAIAEERNRLVQKMRAEKPDGGNSNKSLAGLRHAWQCEDIALYKGN